MPSSPPTSTPPSSSGNLDQRAARIRDNQRRSRARKREYLQSLETRLKRCQEEGVQANVELQRAARRVVEDNRLLRVILEEKGLDTEYIDSRLVELRATSAVNGSKEPTPGVDDGSDSHGTRVGSEALDTFLEMPSDNWADMGIFGDGGDGDDCCGGAGGCDDGIILANTPQTNSPAPFSLDTFTSPAIPAVPEATYPPPLSIPSAPANLPSMVSPPLPQQSFLPQQPSSMPLNPPEPISSGCCGPASSSCAPLGICPPMRLPTRIVPKETSTPCTVAYRLLKALNERRDKERDMFEIVTELWHGFGGPPEGDDDPDGCRVEDAVLLKVAQKMLEN